MITDKTLDEAMVEAARFLKAAKALRKARKQSASKYKGPVALVEDWQHYDQHRQHAACKRASLDLTRKLADLRAGR